MDLKEIKNLINEEGKLVIADENGPMLVVMSYNDYKKLKNGSQNAAGAVDQLPIKSEHFPEEIRSNSFGLDDLPF